MTNTRQEYEKEKAAAKLVTFYKSLDDFFAIYMEIKMYYPPIAEVVDREFPFLTQMYENAADAIDYNKDNDKETGTHE